MFWRIISGDGPDYDDDYDGDGDGGDGGGIMMIKMIFTMMMMNMVMVSDLVLSLCSFRRQLLTSHCLFLSVVFSPVY